MKQKAITGALALAALAAAAAHGAKIELGDAKDGHAVPETLWGIFFEDINWAADGGIYPEQLANAGFDWGQDSHPRWNCKVDGWEGDFRDGGMARLSFQYGAPVHPNTAKHLRIESFGTGLAGVRNRGYDGIFLETGAEYTLSFRWREIALDGIDYALGEWESFSAVFAAGEEKTFPMPFGRVALERAGDGRWTLSLLVEGRRAVEFDCTSLQPRDTIAGLRRDLVEKLAALKPAFVRFPGGCIAEGNDFHQWFDWRRTVGPRERRECVLNRWTRSDAPYWETFGLGYYEYFLLCEALGAEPLPICLAGVTCQFHKPVPVCSLEDADYFAQVILELIEFANGDVSTKWGAVRAAMGHPAPFNLKMVGIGNENWGDVFLDRYDAIQRIVKAKHPEIKLVSSVGAAPDGKDFERAWIRLTDKTADFADEHYYKSPEWFRAAAHRYDRYPRSGKPKVYAGEYACHDKTQAKANNLRSALCEAAAMTGFERNSDVVAMASYAPLFARIGHDQWHPNLIWFDGVRSFATPNYHVQRLFSINRPTRTLPAADDFPKDDDTLFYCAGIDDATGETILKFVNISDAERTVAVNLRGKARLSILAGDPAAVNTIDAENIKPVESVAVIDGSITLPPNSLVVARVAK